MGLFNKIVSSFSHKHGLVPAKNNPYSTESEILINNIRPDILSLLYFKNGKHQNINFDTTEPSAVNIKLPISDLSASNTGYYPSYDNLTPEQRYFFINWLRDIKLIDDLGYPFLLLYCLERHIYQNRNTKEAVKIIKELHSTFNNSSFNYYSSVALVWASHKYHNISYLEGIDFSKLPTSIRVFIELEREKKLTSTEIMKISSDVGWKNLRYIKKYPKLFKDKLEIILENKYHLNYFPCPDKFSKGINSIDLLLSNYSLPENERTVAFPNLLNSHEVGAVLYGLLHDTHEEVKKHLRVNHNLYSQDKPKTKATINARTGFPLAKISSIERTKEEINEFNSYPYKKDKEELINIATTSYGVNGVNYAIHAYSQSIVGNRILEGELAYKTGDWDVAEEKLLPCLMFNPNCVERLAIMYHKQKRFKDEIDVLNSAIIQWNSSPFNTEDGSTRVFEERLSKAKRYYSSHKSNDQSVGIIDSSIPYDEEFLRKLITIKNKYLKGKD